MSAWLTTFPFILLLAIPNNVISCKQELDVVPKKKKELDVVQMARTGVLHAMNWARAYPSLHGPDHGLSQLGVALGDCVELYEETEPRLARLLSGETYSREDALTWLSGALASHRTCLDGLEEKGWLSGTQSQTHHQNLTLLLRNGLAFYGPKSNWRAKSNGGQKRPKYNQSEGLLASWDATTSKADFVVAKDGSGNFRTINEAVSALARMAGKRPRRVIIYVKSGLYNEKVEIRRDMKNVMLVGDGMDRTIVTGNRNVHDGASTLNSATFGVSGDGFWARDMTFENTAGPQKHQAVALRVSSDLSVFYRCSFNGYQDTLLVHSQRQFYRDCRIYGTVDFIFGDASVVFQNCDIYVKRPMDHQSNMITAQGRDDPDENSGISIVNSRVAPAPGFNAVKGQFKSFLGRPWKKYSRTVFLKTDMDGLIDPKGWTEWRGNFALSTLYYGEYNNSGGGASTRGRVRWPGFHVLKDPHEATPFTVRNFIQGHLWIPVSGVPFWPEI